MQAWSTQRPAMVGLVILMGGLPAQAQTLGYADSLQVLAQNCTADIERHCKSLNFGGGRVLKCLGDKAAAVSPACKTSIADTRALLATRAGARAAVVRICANDIIRACPEVKPGDGNILDCYLKSKHLFTPACRQAALDAGYEVKVDPAAQTTQVALGGSDLSTSLQAIEQAAPDLTATSLKQRALLGMKDPARSNRLNRAPLVAGLENRAQLTIAIQFDLNSARIKPESFKAVGLMADALYHPYLQGHRFLIVGHTDGTGSRDYNLRLSQQRAEAIREALINPFGIAPSRIEAVGLGEEQLLRPAAPESGENRRVQLINIGPVR